MMKKKFFEKDIIFIIGIILFRILLDLNYSQVISPYFEYAGFYNNKTITSTIISWISFCFSIPFIIKIKNSKYPLSKVIFLFLYFLSFIPVTSLIQFTPQTNYFEFWILLYWYIFIIAYLYIIIHKGLVIKINKNKRCNFLFWLIPLFVIAGVLFTSGYYRGFKVSVNAFNVYELRTEEKSWGIPTYVAYLLDASNVILSTFLYYTLNKKKYIISGLITIIMLLDFGIGANKIIFFTLCLVYILYFLHGWKVLKLLPFLFSFLLLLSILIYKLTDSYFFTSILRRAFYIPAQINYFYYDFFSTHMPDYFANSFMRHFGIVSKYGSVSDFIGNYYYGREINLNNGLFSDAILNLGIPGIIIFPFFTIILLVILNSVSKNIPLNNILLLGLLIAITLYAGCLVSSLLDGGILLLILMILNYPTKNYKSHESLSSYNCP